MTYEEDMATTLPSKADEFVHVGSEVYTRDNNNLFVIPKGIDVDY